MVRSILLAVLSSPFTYPCRSDIADTAHQCLCDCSHILSPSLSRKFRDSDRMAKFHCTTPNYHGSLHLVWIIYTTRACRSGWICWRGFWVHTNHRGDIILRYGYCHAFRGLYSGRPDLNQSKICSGKVWWSFGWSIFSSSCSGFDKVSMAATSRALNSWDHSIHITLCLWGSTSIL